MRPKAQFMCETQFMRRKAQFMCETQFMRLKAQFMCGQAQFIGEIACRHGFPFEGKLAGEA